MRPFVLLLAVVPVAAASTVAARPSSYEDHHDPSVDEGGALGVDIALDAELFGGARYTATDDDHLTRFELDRGEVGVRLAYGKVVSAELRLETFRSFGAPELRGDARPDGDDPLIVRARRAWGAWHEPRRRRDDRPRFEVRGGLIPEPWLEAIEGGYDLRALAPTAAEHAGLIEHADLGLATIAVWKMLRLEVALTNGEGGVRPEVNRGKNVAGILTARTPRLPGDLVVATHFYGRRGSRGADPVRSHRVGAAITLDGPRLGAGVEMVAALGVGDRDDLVATTTGVWAHATVMGRTGLAARFDWTGLADQVDAVGRRHTTTLALWRDLVPRGSSRVRDFGVRAYLAAQLDRARGVPTMAGVAAPFDANRLMLILQASARETVD